MLFHKSALDRVPFATPKWILSVFSMTSLDIQLRCSKHLVAPDDSRLCWVNRSFRIAQVRKCLLVNGSQDEFRSF